MKTLIISLVLGLSSLAFAKEARAVSFFAERQAERRAAAEVAVRTTATQIPQQDKVKSSNCSEQDRSAGADCHHHDESQKCC